MRRLKGEGMTKQQIIRKLLGIYKEKGFLETDDITTCIKPDDNNFDEIINTLAYKGLLPTDIFDVINKDFLKDQINLLEHFNEEKELKNTQIKDFSRDNHDKLLKEKHFDESLSSSNDFIGMYLKEIGQIDLLEPEEEIELAKMIEEELKHKEDYQRLVKDKYTFSKEEIDMYERVFRKGNFARQKLIESNLRLVFSIAKRYVNSGMPLLDLIQEGNMGLMKAVDKFDYKKGNKFSTYATWWIRQAITRSIADQAKTIRIPVHMVETINTMLKIERRLTNELKREPTDEEIAFDMGVEPGRIQTLRKIAQDPISLEKPVGEEEDSTLGDLISDHDMLDPMEYTAKESLIREINLALQTLTDREERVLRMRYGLWGNKPKTLEEVGKEFNVTRERIRQIESKAIEKLRSENRFEILKYYAEKS